MSEIVACMDTTLGSVAPGVPDPLTNQESSSSCVETHTKRGNRGKRASKDVEISKKGGQPTKRRKTAQRAPAASFVPSPPQMPVYMSQASCDTQQAAATLVGQQPTNFQQLSQHDSAAPLLVSTTPVRSVPLAMLTPVSGQSIVSANTPDGAGVPFTTSQIQGSFTTQQSMINSPSQEIINAWNAFLMTQGPQFKSAHANHQPSAAAGATA